MAPSSVSFISLPLSSAVNFLPHVIQWWQMKASVSISLMGASLRTVRQIISSIVSKLTDRLFAGLLSGNLTMTVSPKFSSLSFFVN